MLSLTQRQMLTHVVSITISYPAIYSSNEGKLGGVRNTAFKAILPNHLGSPASPDHSHQGYSPQQPPETHLSPNTYNTALIGTALTLFTRSLTSTGTSSSLLAKNLIH